MASRKERVANPEGRMALKEHLIELRNRLFIALGALLVTTIAGFFLYYPVLDILIQPVKSLGGEVNFTTAVSPFDTMIQVSVFLGVVLSAPIWLYQIWAFIVPGLHKNEKKYALGFIGAALPLFLLGLYLGFWVLPHALQFFMGLTPGTATNIIGIDVYLPFVLRLLLAFGIAMIVPVLMVGLNFMGILPGKLIVKHWRITVFLICLVAAMAAPGGDALTMLVLAGPLLILFAVATIFCLVRDKRVAKKRAEQEAENERMARGEGSSLPKPETID
ncbi:sec-independent protein translocase protein TatC [Neomicrococcus aestuarii]|uniref:Sec-independent protein translocase protein TatC n=1 Tax=Neomicrococcus aestuarii TaxID=556325 RepID=A0A7W8TUP7_9MICC|nr:twin-arginine translocase subunit TatC [Neomicrococcus aestuarii]MBB5511891.1 sec-independent protein translocase protein TatC [Neomicrococcus aestuarii]